MQPRARFVKFAWLCTSDHPPLSDPALRTLDSAGVDGDADVVS